jgi:hypothetical protein
VLQESKGYRLKRLKQESLSLSQKNLPTFSYELLKRFVRLFIPYSSSILFFFFFLCSLCHFCGSSPQKLTLLIVPPSPLPLPPHHMWESIFWVLQARYVFFCLLSLTHVSPLSPLASLLSNASLHASA